MSCAWKWSNTSYNLLESRSWWILLHQVSLVAVAFSMQANFQQKSGLVLCVRWAPRRSIVQKCCKLQRCLLSWKLRHKICSLCLFIRFMCCSPLHWFGNVRTLVEHGILSGELCLNNLIAGCNQVPSTPILVSTSWLSPSTSLKLPCWKRLCASSCHSVLILAASRPWMNFDTLWGAGGQNQTIRNLSCYSPSLIRWWRSMHHRDLKHLTSFFRRSGADNDYNASSTGMVNG